MNLPCCRDHFSKAEAAGRPEFLTVPHGFTPIDKHFGEEPWDHKSSGTTLKGWKTARPPVSLYLNELLIQK